jgi:hypothetical protein
MDADWECPINLFSWHKRRRRTLKRAMRRLMRHQWYMALTDKEQVEYICYVMVYRKSFGMFPNLKEKMEFTAEYDAEGTLIIYYRKEGDEEWTSRKQSRNGTTR